MNQIKSNQYMFYNIYCEFIIFSAKPNYVDFIVNIKPCN